MNPLRLESIETSAGPQVMFIGEMNAAFGELVALFGDLARGDSRSIEVHELPFINSQSGISLTATCVDRRQGDVTEGVTRISTTPPEFIWRHSGPAWEDDGLRIRSLCASKKACHQCLTSYPTDEATIVVSKGEYDIQQFRRH